MVDDQAGDLQLITHLIKICINGWTRNLLLDLSRKLRLLLDICHSLVNLVNCPGQCKRAHSGGIREETYRFPWMCFRASEAFFIAAIVSWFIFADSSVFTFISSWNFVPCSFSNSLSNIFFRFNAAREAAHPYASEQCNNIMSPNVKRLFRYREVWIDIPALLDTALALALANSS